MAEFDIWIFIARTPLFVEGGEDDAWCKFFLGIRRAILYRLEEVKGCRFVADFLDVVTHRDIVAAKDKTRV